MSTPVIADDSKLKDFLAPSGLVPEDVPDWKLVNKFEVNRILGTNSHNKIKCDCIAIPYVTYEGDPIMDRGMPFCRARLLEPETQTDSAGKSSTKKYASPAGCATHIYVPIGLKNLINALSETESAECPPLVITEGEKKAEALVKLGIPAVGLPGITMGLVRDDPANKDEPRNLLAAIPDLVEKYAQAVPAEQTPRVLVLFDSDGQPGDAFPDSHALKDGKHVGNKSVFFEAKLLANTLRKVPFSRPVAASAAWCPRGPVGDDGKPGKLGVDDWIEQAKKDHGTPDVVVRAIHALSNLPASPSAVAQASTQRGESFRVLGFEDSAVMVWSHGTQQLNRLSAADLSRAASIMLAVGPDAAMARWAKIAKDGSESLDTQAAAASLIRDAFRAGMWTDARERGGGVWVSDDGDLRINAREGFFRAARNGLVPAEDERLSGRHVYPACSRFSIGSVPAAPRDGRVLSQLLVKHLKQWGWKQKTAPYLLAGWICQQSFLGALNARPHVTLIGESGAGKSVLAEHIGEVLNGTAYRIEDGAGTTAAGMRQTIGKDAMTILLDEAEPGANQGQVAEQRAATMRRTLDMLRAAYSASDSGHVRTTLKGSASGKAVDYSIRVSAMINAINRPDFDQADRNRFLLLEVVKDGRGTGEPDASGLADLGSELRAVLWQRWEDFNAIYNHILGLADLGEARLRKTWGVPIAALMALSYGEAWEENVAAIEQLARAVATEQDDSDSGGGDSDHERARKALMSALIDCEVLEERGESVSVAVRKRTIFEVFQAAKKANPRAADNHAGKALKRVGLMRSDGENGPRLFVSDNQQLRTVLRGTPWATGQSIVNALGRLEGAVMTATKPVETRPKIDGSRRSGVYIPVDEDGAASPRAAGEDTDLDAEF